MVKVIPSHAKHYRVDWTAHNEEGCGVCEEGAAAPCHQEVLGINPRGAANPYPVLALFAFSVQMAR